MAGLTAAWNILEKKRFFPVILKSGFFERSLFSELKADLVIQDTHITLDQLYSVPEDRLCAPSTVDIIDIAMKNITRTVIDEKTFMVNFTANCLVKLGDVTLNPEYLNESIIYSMKNVQEWDVGNIGIGTHLTWHGIPDAQVRGLVNSEVAVTLDQDTLDQDALDQDTLSTFMRQDSDGMSVLVEAKLTVCERNLPQIYATAVVSSFTDKNRHKRNGFTPAILLGRNYIVAALYDCSNDVLLVSELLEFVSDQTAVVTGVFFLWILINSRYLPIYTTVYNEFPYTDTL